MKKNICKFCKNEFIEEGTIMVGVCSIICASKMDEKNEKI